MFAFEAVLSALRDRGYSVVEKDEPRRFLRAQSQFEGDTVGSFTFASSSGPNSSTGNGVIVTIPRVSYLQFQISTDGRVGVTAAGFHVSRDRSRICAPVADEIAALVQEIAQRAAAMAGAEAPRPGKE